jgi:glycosyltransferase involved in cell wall biosynthesis
VPRDDPDGLAKTLERLLADPELQERLRAGGFATVARYTWDRAIGVLDDFYRLIARERSRRL